MFFQDDINKSKPFIFSSLPIARAYSPFSFLHFCNFGYHQFEITFDLFCMPSIAFELTPTTKSAFSYIFLFFLIPCTVAICLNLFLLIDEIMEVVLLPCV